MCLKENKISWLVGIIEGEGCFSIAKGYKKSTYFNVTINITNTDIFLLRECESIVKDILECNCRIRNRKENYNVKKRSDLVIEGLENISNFITKIKSFIIGEKKLQAEIMLSYVNRRLLLRKNNKSPKCDSEDEKYYKAISVLKHLTEPVETIRFLSHWDNDIVRTANIDKIAEMGRNVPFLTN